MFMNYAVFENTASFAATNDQPEFGPLRAVYPDSATAHPHLFRRVAIPGICVGEEDGRTELQAKAAWKADAEFFKAQPGYVSAQLHQGILSSLLFLNYAIFENTAAFAATNGQPEFGPLRKVYPGSATAHPHLFRRLSIPAICVGEGNRPHADS